MKISIKFALFFAVLLVCSILAVSVIGYQSSVSAIQRLSKHEMQSKMLLVTNELEGQTRRLKDNIVHLSLQLKEKLLPSSTAISTRPTTRPSPMPTQRSVPGIRALLFSALPYLRGRGLALLSNDGKLLSSVGDISLLQTHRRDWKAKVFARLRTQEQSLVGSWWEKKEQKIRGIWAVRLRVKATLYALVLVFDWSDWLCCHGGKSVGGDVVFGVYATNGLHFLHTSKRKKIRRSHVYVHISKRPGVSGFEVYVGDDGLHAFVGWRRVPHLAWIVFVRSKHEEAFLTLERLKRRSYMGAVLLLGLTLFGVFFFSRTQLAPIEELTNITRRIRNGESHLRATPKRRDEIGELAQHFNELTDEVMQAQERFRTLFQTASDAIITINSQQEITLFNQQAEDIFGYTAQEAIGQPLEILLPENIHKQHRHHVEGFAVDGESRRLMGARRELSGRRKDGSLFPLEASIAKMPFDDKFFFTAIVRDVTERKQAREVLQRAHDELERRVEDRTRELQEANEELKTFAYIVSHDLRSPLVNIKGFAGELRLSIEDVQQLLETGGEDVFGQLSFLLKEDIPESLEFIDAATSRMDRLINAILKLSRVGHRKLYMETLALDKVVNDTLISMRHQIETQGVDIEVGEFGEVTADPTSLEQILGNLLTNAVQYLLPTRKGQIRIFEERDAEYTTIHVQDNGRGIAEEDHAKVFQIFRRLGTQDVPGEGMGLSYVQALVRRHGGRIWFTSTLHEGSTFSFSLPHQIQEE
ncbi:MAG: hypothetical protein CL920_08040 [Deltaproteobacteria bacterium]|nr:hypothetical protein [Deltaproteobacteria bacterium]MBU48630.1 hypothetical protein [Deltaproteobacteria bacterium]